MITPRRRRRHYESRLFRLGNQVRTLGIERVVNSVTPAGVAAAAFGAQRVIDAAREIYDALPSVSFSTPQKRLRGSRSEEPGISPKRARYSPSMAPTLGRKRRRITPTASRVARRRSIKRYRKRVRRSRYIRRKYCKPRQCYRTHRLARRALKLANHTISTHTRRVFFTAIITPPGNNKSICEVFGGLTKDDVQNALTVLRFYDPSTNTLVTKDVGSLANYPGEIMFRRVAMNMRLYNPASSPAECNITIVRCKGDTSIDPVEAWRIGLTDHAVGAGFTPAISDWHMKYNESPLFRTDWSVVSSKTVTLFPGQSHNVGYSVPGFTFHEPTTTEENTTYTPDHKSFAVIVRVRGHCGVYTTNAVPNVLDRSVVVFGGRPIVHVSGHVTYKLQYDAGTKLSDYSRDIASLVSAPNRVAMLQTSKYVDVNGDVVAGNDPV